MRRISAGRVLARIEPYLDAGAAPAKASDRH
jgi:hypothetical protein